MCACSDLTDFKFVFKNQIICRCNILEVYQVTFIRVFPLHTYVFGYAIYMFSCAHGGLQTPVYVCNCECGNAP